MNLFNPGRIRTAPRHGLSGKIMWQIAVGTNLSFLTGCRGAPSINLVGSFFPAWMLCMIIGVVGSLLLRRFFIKANIDQHLPLRAFVYFCLWVFVTLLTWLLFFRS